VGEGERKGNEMGYDVAIWDHLNPSRALLLLRFGKRVAAISVNVVLGRNDAPSTCKLDVNLPATR